MTLNIYKKVNARSYSVIVSNSKFVLQSARLICIPLPQYTVLQKQMKRPRFHVNVILNGQRQQSTL